MLRPATPAKLPNTGETDRQTHTHRERERERRRRRRKEKKIGISAAVTPRIQFSNVREFLPSPDINQQAKKKYTHLTVVSTKPKASFYRVTREIDRLSAI